MKTVFYVSIENNTISLHGSYEIYWDSMEYIYKRLISAGSIRRYESICDGVYKIHTNLGQTFYESLDSEMIDIIKDSLSMGDI